MINNSHFHNLPTDVHVLIASRLENPRDWKAYRSLCKKTYEVSKRDVFQNRNTPFLNSRRTAEALENLLTNNYVKIEDKARFIHYGYPAAKFSNLTFTIFSKKTLRIANDERTLEKEIQFSKAIKTYNVFLKHLLVCSSGKIHIYDLKKFELKHLLKTSSKIRDFSLVANSHSLYIISKFSHFILDYNQSATEKNTESKIKTLYNKILHK